MQFYSFLSSRERECERTICIVRRSGVIGWRGAGGERLSSASSVERMPNAIAGTGVRRVLIAFLPTRTRSSNSSSVSLWRENHLVVLWSERERPSFHRSSCFLPWRLLPVVLPALLPVLLGLLGLLRLLLGLLPVVLPLVLLLLPVLVGLLLLLPVYPGGRRF